MRIEFEIDDELARRLLHLTGQTSMADALRHATKVYVSREAAERFERIAGSIEFDPEYLADRERMHPGTAL